MPIITPAQEADYPGTLYTLVDMKPLAMTYDDMVKNAAAGKFPTPLQRVLCTTMDSWEPMPSAVCVEREGRRVLFKGWPYRNVAYSAWEFLRRQGVVWSAPTDHAETVPAPAKG